MSKRGDPANVEALMAKLELEMPKSTTPNSKLVDWSIPRPATSTPFFERFGGYRKVADINPWTSLNRRSERHLNPLPKTPVTKYYFMIAFGFAISFTWLIKKPLLKLLIRGLEKPRENTWNLLFKLN